MGLAGLALSMYAFGLARAFPALVAARCLNGALNGNIGVIKRYDAFFHIHYITLLTSCVGMS